MTELADRIAGLSAAKRALLQRLRVAGVPAPLPAVPRRDAAAAPLSFEQRRLWFAHRLADGAAYTIPAAFRLRGPVDADALARALAVVAARHEALRTVVRERGDAEPEQVVDDAAAPALRRADVRGTADPRREAAARVAALLREPFDLARGPLWRALLVRVAEDEHVLAFAAHHIVADGASLGVFYRELGSAYAAALRGAEPGLPPVGLQLPDFAAWQRAGHAGEAREAETAWWREALEGAPRAFELPPDFPRPPVQAFSGAKHACALPAETTDALRAFARAEGATPFAVVLAAFAAVLQRYTGADDFLLGVATANRDVRDAEGAIGFFANVVPARVRPGGDPTGRELVARVRDAVLAAYDHRALSFDRIVEAAGGPRDASRPPLVQVVATHAPDDDALAFPGVAVEPFPADTGAAPFDLTFTHVERPADVRLELQYRTDLYEAPTIRRLARHLVTLLESLLRAPERRVSELEMADEVPLPPAPSPRPRPAFAPSEGLGRRGRGEGEDCIHHLFELQARATPDATAVAWNGESVGYGELDRRASVLARRLRALGVGPETRVGVLMERTPSLVAALLAVLKAGGAYVPLDPRNPPARLAAMLQASGAGIVVTDPGARDRLPSTPAVHELLVTPETLASPGDERIDSRAFAPSHSRASHVDPGNLAYIVFTSGSTGGPKGVEVRHSSVVAMLRGWWEMLAQDERSAVLGAATAAFDFSVAEIFGTLCGGGTLVLVDDALADVPAEPPVRTMCGVPTAFAELVRAGRIPPSVRTVVVGGEPVPLALVRALHATGTVRRVVNVYGPTEDTVVSTFAELPADAPRAIIGPAAFGGQAYVLDARLRRAPIGVPGELYLAGDGLARGYAGRPALTAERFVPSPFGPPGARMYRTLDLARRREEGALEHLGRADDQVKVRGHRIEPGEVEAALAAHPAVREAAVAPRDDGEAKRLVAWIVSANRAAPSPAELRAWARDRLSEPMVPAAFVVVDALPRSPSGKLDRRALPDPVASDAPSPVEHAEPRTPGEKLLAPIWCEVIGAAHAGVHDDFFELGGNSLLALRLVSRIREETGRELPLRLLFEAPTIARMAAVLANGNGHGADALLPVVALQPLGERPPLFVVHAGGGHVMCYEALAAALAPAQPLYALQARGLEGREAPLRTVPEMAAHYVEGIRRVQPRGPYRLAGWSFGGVAALEMARQLEAAGEEVAFLGFFDTMKPEPRSTQGIALDFAPVLKRVLIDVFGWAAASRVSESRLRGLELPAQVRAASESLGEKTFPASRFAEVELLARARHAVHNALVDYAPGPVDARITLFRTASSARTERADEVIAFWGALAGGGLDLHPVPGSHGTVIQRPHVQVLAEKLLSVLSRSG